MVFARVLLGISGILFALYGLACLFVPSLVAEASGLEMPNASARAEVAAMYGGFQAGFGFFMLHCARRVSTLRMGLWVLVTMVGSIGLGRAIGMLMQGASIYNLSAFAYECITSLLGLLAMRSLGDSKSEG